MESSTENIGKPGKPKGLPKSGGRVKGTLNKKSYWLRDQLESVNFSWAHEFKNCMETNNYDKAKILVDLLPYLNPRIEPRNVDDSESTSDDLNVNISLNGLIMNEQNTND